MPALPLILFAFGATAATPLFMALLAPKGEPKPKEEKEQTYRGPAIEEPPSGPLD
jgi:hypothetical protein